MTAWDFALFAIAVGALCGAFGWFGYVLGCSRTEARMLRAGKMSIALSEDGRFLRVTRPTHVEGTPTIKGRKR